MIKKITKQFNMIYNDKLMILPEDLKSKIDAFWNNAQKENPCLYNGTDFSIENIEEKENETIISIAKTTYSHYLYTERVGIKEREHRCIAPWCGILLLTNDNYWVLGQMSQTTSVPKCFQIAGGSIDNKDIKENVVDLTANLKRELKEEMNLNLDEIKYRFEYIECPDEKRNAYGFLAIGNLDMTKKEFENSFEKYKQYIIENNLELEFDKLIFLNKGKAVKELDEYKNPKRPYLRDLILAADCG